MTEFDKYTIVEIDLLIKEGKCTEQDVIHFYNNEWWRDSP